MIRRGLAVASAAAFATAALAAPVIAAPTGGGGEEFPLVCTGGIGAISIVAPPNDASWTPGFITGTHQVLIPYAFHFEFSSSGSPEVFVEDQVKPAPVPADAFTCTLNTSGTDPETGETFTGTGTVVAVLRGKP